MKRARRIAIVIVVMLGIGALGATAQRAGENVAPRFEVDAAWPKPLPHRWLMGQAAGVAVDARDHIWVVQRPKSLTEDERGATLTPPRSLCCVPAPPVLEFDAEGNLLQAWGGPGAGYEWPENEHGIHVDHEGHVWRESCERSTSHVEPLPRVAGATVSSRTNVPSLRKT